MRNILISIKPEWVEKILNGEKTIEIRKSIPKCKLPCKVYIYCTKGKDLWMHNKETIILGNTNLTSYLLNGKVVAEFILKHFNKFDYDGLVFYEMKDLMLKQSCLTDLELKKYAKNKTCYAWHIKSLKIYDNPKELSEFDRPEIDLASEDCRYGVTCPMYKHKKLKRPPQSWCYVEEKVE